MQRKIINPLIQDTITFVRTSAETHGELSELELTLMLGGGPPLHYHTSFTETFTAIEGELEIQTEDGQRTLRPGDSFTVPIGVEHRFHNATGHEITFRAVTRPGSPGFENALCIVYGLAADGLTDAQSVPRSFTHLAIMSVLGDTYLPGFFRLLNPVLRWLVHRAQKDGTVRVLVHKYRL